MNNTTKRNLALVAVFIAALVVGTFATTTRYVTVSCPAESREIEVLTKLVVCLFGLNDGKSREKVQ
jgi:hypothetical protein